MIASGSVGFKSGTSFKFMRNNTRKSQRSMTIFKSSPDNAFKRLNSNFDDDRKNTEDRMSSQENLNKNVVMANLNLIKLNSSDKGEKSESLSSIEIIKIGPNNQSIFKEKFEIEKEYTTNFIKTKEIEFLYYQYLYNAFFECIFCITSIICAIMQYEWEYSYNNDALKKTPQNESMINIANCFCFINSLFLLIVYIYEHYINCRSLFLRKNLPERIWRKKFEMIFSLVLKFLISILHPNPLFFGIELNMYNEKYHVNAVYSLNSLMTVFCLLRIWCVFKFYLIYSDFYSPRAQRICQMNSFDTSLNFSMKANMSKTPQYAYLILFLIILSYCTYCIRIFERVLDDVSGINFSSLWNCIWCIIITMTTVGYGDFYPSSFLGRIIGIVSCTCGVFLISMLIVTISNLFDLTSIEENVFKIIQRIKLTKEKDEIAANFVTKYLKILNKMKKSKSKIKKKVGDELLLGMYNLKEKVKEIDDTFQHYGETDVMKDQLSYLEVSIDEMKQNYDAMNAQVKEIKEMLTNRIN